MPSCLHDGWLNHQRCHRYSLILGNQPPPDTDWLAFAHIVIALAFIGSYRDPVRNIWVIEFSLIACVLVVPMALLFGSLRGIPLFWRLIDCSFGVVGFIPLWVARQQALRLAKLLHE